MHVIESTDGVYQCRGTTLRGTDCAREAGSVDVVRTGTVGEGRT
jgi:hypothetical protein